MGLSIKQRVKVNAALSMIYAQGYDAQTVVTWAKDYEGMGHSPARAYQMALNEFAAGQPDLGVSLGKITRLVEASDVATVAKYDVALSEFISTGDDSALVALGPMIAQDSVALAVKNRELPEGALTGEAIEAAIGFAMADDVVTQAATPAAQQNASPEAPQARPEDAYSSQLSVPQAQRQTFPGFGSQSAPAQAKSTDKQTSPYAAGGRVANQARWDAVPNIGGGTSRTLLQGHRLGSNGLHATPAPVFKSKAEIRADYANAGPTVKAETI
ncbi:hypothetical protein [Phenylobacterium sp.]|uniref:hypothetical protein n=1 Tax=Phenylobacterium sp. TaxID=1871053 RepID=UPI0035B381EC